MNIYLLSQDQNNGYDTYDSVVVAAETPEIAVRIYPNEYCIWDDEVEAWRRSYGTKDIVDRFYDWVTHIDKIKCEKIGIADDSIPSGIILASFNAG